MQKLETLYPNPPLIIFLSNNEAVKLAWTEVETSKRYMDLYGAGRSDDFKRQVVAEGWVARYSELIRGFRDGLSNSNWKNNSKFFGYNAFGPSHLGRWGGWKDYSLYIPNRIDPNPLIWDSGSPSFYYADYAINSDYQVMSPAMEAMNWDFMQKEARELNPDFWFELSTWAGTDSVKQIYTSEGQSWTPERYAGSVQFGMWLVRPRIVRDFPYAGSSVERSASQPWMDTQIAAVDRVYNNSTLTTFWRQGTLVANTSRLHPYQTDIPPEYASAQRMFLLNTNLDPAQPWALDTVLPVFSLARVIGTTPNRQWLVYANSPQQDRTNVQVTIPNYHDVTINTTVAGSFYLVDEASNTVTDVTAGPPKNNTDESDASDRVSSRAGQFTPSERARRVALMSTPVVDVVDQVPTVTTFNFTSNLELGARGQDVVELQDRLRTEGYFSVDSTGYFGLTTYGAVRAYQSAHGIADTGFVGPITRAMLNTSSSLSASSLTPEEKQSAIIQIRTKLISLIQQLIVLLQHQVSNM